MLVDRESHVAGKDETRKLKLSEAIRIGAAKRPQAMGHFYLDGGSCVLGAAYEGIGHELTPLLNCWPNPVYSTLGLYFGHSPHDGFLGGLADRNNGGESRESIADSLERQGL